MALCNYFQVDLDLPPEVRWLHVIKEKRPQILTFYNEFLQLVNLSKENVELISEKIRFSENEYMIELRSISQELEVELINVYLVNLITEISCSCTTIPFQPEEGFPMMVKNLDVSGKTSSIIGVFIDLEFVKGGKVVFRAPGIAGMVGVANGVKPNAFSLTLNNRYDSNLNKMMDAILANDSPVMWLLRKVLEESENYDQAVSRLKTEKLISGIYYIISGSKRNDAESIARDRESVRLESKLSSHSWFLVQTNSDINEPDPEGRREAAELKMWKMSPSSVSQEHILTEILEEKPNFRPNITRASILFDSEKGSYGFKVYFPSETIE